MSASPNSASPTCAARWKENEGFTAPADWARNTPQQLHARLDPLRRDGSLPDYPLGSDFTDVEQRLARALAWLKQRTASHGARLRTLAAAITSGPTTDVDAMTRMQLHAPRIIKERLYARLLRHALAQCQR